MNTKSASTLNPLVWSSWALPLLLLLLGLSLTFSSLNIDWFLGIQHLNQFLPDSLWSNITALGDTAAALAIGLVLLPKRQQRVAILPAAILGTLFTHIPKYLLSLPRPAAVLPTDMIHIIGSKLLHNSLPSGHTLTAFMLVSLVVLLCNYRFRYAWWLAAIAVGLSRIAVGAHWPGDVLTGAALGWMSAKGGVLMVEQWDWLNKKAVARVVDGFSAIAMGYLFLELPRHYPHTHLSIPMLGMVILFWRYAHDLKNHTLSVSELRTVEH